MLTYFKQMLTNFPQKSPKYFCEKCEIKTNNKKDFSKHLMTSKHLKMTNNEQNLTKIPQISPHHICNICLKEYKSRTGLWSHMKKCNLDSKIININHNNNNNHTIMKKVLEQNQHLIEQNKKLSEETCNLKEFILEVCKNMNMPSHIYHTTNNTNNNHNQTFNLQIFLNETCKNAMNIMDFVDSIQLQLSDLEKVGQLGFIDGISDIIIKNLKALDVTERPVHCSDSKREVVYVKDENKWEKENAENEKMRKAIKRVAHKNIQLIPKWKEKFPDCVYSNSTKSDQYNHIVIEAMGGDYKTNRKDSENRIIKKIAKEVVIDK